MNLKTLKTKTLLIISSMLFVSACGTQPTTKKSVQIYGYGISNVVNNILLTNGLTFHERMQKDIHDDYRRYHFAILPITTTLTKNDPTIREKLPLIHEILEKALLDSGKIEVYNLKSAYWDYKLKCKLTTPKEKETTIDFPINQKLECMVQDRK